MAMVVDAGADGKRQRTMLAVAVAHPVRTRCFAILGERVGSPADIARELFLDVNQVAYHIRQLCDWGLVEEVDSRPVRGAVEHFYKAVEFGELSAEEEETQFPAERRQHAETVLSLFTADAVRSLDTELLYTRTDHYLNRYTYDVDEQAWAESREAYRECFEKIDQIKKSADARLEARKDAGDGEAGKPFRMMSFLGMFEVPPLRDRSTGE
ncbi:MAG: hypothetical protein ACRDPE_23545 [Solirubrobacterales bacterium]